MKFLSTFFQLYLFALRLALLAIASGKLRLGLYLLVRPIDYWRVYEFPIALEFLRPSPGEHILDESSPKLLPLFIASRFGSLVYPMDIYDDQGLTVSMTYRKHTSDKNIYVTMSDMRRLPFPDETFDKVFTISALEHVFPAEGGDVVALREAARVLKPGGIAVVTIPYGNSSSVEYRNADVYDRKRDSEEERVFYQRRYDAESLARLVEQCSSLKLEAQEFICERFFRWRGKELCNVISEGNKIKRLSLAPFYSLFAFIFLTRSAVPLPGSDYMIACVKLRKIQ